MTVMSPGVKNDERPARNDGEQQRAHCVPDQAAIDGCQARHQNAQVRRVA